jgi:hypothetical protein
MPATMNPSFDISREEHEIIQKIVDRAIGAAREAGIRVDRMTMLMDLTATHANGMPLRLVSLLEAESFDFNHDVFGISRHINRQTGQLEDCFVPRFAA